MDYFDDLKIGKKIITKGRSVTEADIVNFAAISGDWHPLHTDIEYCKKGPFGERIAHGFLVLTIASGLMPLAQMAVLAFYGMDSVRFLNPTRIGDTIHLDIEVVEKEDKNSKSGVVSFKTTVMNQKDEAACIFTMKMALHRK